MTSQTYRNPTPTVDVILESDLSSGEAAIVLIERKSDPKGWALPGGFVDEGECVEDAARREVMEETGVTATLHTLLGVYSDPKRDPRKHTMSVVYIARYEGVPNGGDDAAQARVFPLSALPDVLCFDHGKIVADYMRWRQTGRIPAPSVK